MRLAPGRTGARRKLQIDRIHVANRGAAARNPQAQRYLVAGYGFGGFLGGAGRFGAVPVGVAVTVRMTVAV